MTDHKISVHIACCTAAANDKTTKHNHQRASLQCDSSSNSSRDDVAELSKLHQTTLATIATIKTVSV